MNTQICLFVILSCVLLLSSAESSNSILLKDIKVLTLNRDERTTARRGSPLPQLKCIGGSAKRYHEFHPAVAQCMNMGTDDRNQVQWKCEAQLDEKVEFGTVRVSCEGYQRPGDERVLRGSCALEYKLRLTEKGKAWERQGGTRSRKPRGPRTPPTNQRVNHQVNQETYRNADPQSYQTGATSFEENSSGSTFATVLVIVVLVALFLCMCTGKSQSRMATGRTHSQPYPQPQPQPQAHSYPFYPPPPNYDSQPTSYTSSFDPDYSTSSYSTRSSDVSLGTAAASTVAGFATGYAVGRATAPPQPANYGNVYPSSVHVSESQTYEHQDTNDDSDKDDSTSRTSYGYGGSTSR